MKKPSIFIFAFSIIIVLLIFVAIYISKTNNRYSKRNVNYKRSLTQSISEKNKIDRVINKYNTYVFGVDFSHYQGKIKWSEIKTIRQDIPISFVFLRATMGTNSSDKYFKHNWSKATKHKIAIGAYHYYRPNENSTKQAYNFIKRVTLVKGNLPPVLDIEQVSTRQSISNLKIGLKNWLNIIEKHYGVKPIIYSGDTFYRNHLSGKEFEGYIIWIANFNKVRSPKTKNWKIWQFSEKGIIKGVNEKVDFNVYKGNLSDFRTLLIK